MKPRAARPYVCLLGVYGKGNLGDEALALTIADAAREALDGGEVVVFGSDPQAVREQFSLPAVSRSPTPEFRTKLRLIRGARALILGGGSLLGDHDGWAGDARAIAAVFFWPLIARLFGVPTIVYGQGLGPAREAPTRWAIRHLLTRMDAISLRDQRSGDLLRTLASPSVSACVTCDPVIGDRRFSPEFIARTIDGDLHERIRGLQPYCAVALRVLKLSSARDEKYYRRLATSLDRFHRWHPTRFLMFPTHISETYHDDREALQIVERHLLRRGVPEENIVRTTWDSFSEATALLQHARFVVGERLHALLLAALAGVPVIGIDFESKIPGCLEMIGLGPGCAVFSLEDVGTPGFDDALRDAYRATDDERANLKERTSRWAARDQRNREMLRSALQSAG